MKILFVCHGNICRSPMAEFIMKDLLKKESIDNVYVASAATSSEEIGNSIYPLAKMELSKHNIDCSGKYARKITRDDYENFDLLIGMDSANIINMNRLFNNDPDEKIFKLLQFQGITKDVDDPWYSGDFDTAYKDILSGCTGLLSFIKEKY